MYEEQRDIFKYIDKTIIINKKISHAYLIETNNYDQHTTFIKEFLKILLTTNCKDDEEKEKISHEIDLDIYPDVRYIYPDGNYIKKEQLLSLEEDFSKKAMNDNFSIYVIYEADRLNDSSANTILKFLEEPEDEIIAILVTNNRYRVLETITSRCQVLSLRESKTKKEYDDSIIDFIKQLKTPEELLCNFDYYYPNLFNDRIMAIGSINKLEEIIFEYINGNINDEKIEIFFDDIKLNQIFDVLVVLSEVKNRLNYNVNMKLWFTDFVIKLIEVK